MRAPFLHRAASFEELWSEVDFATFPIPERFNLGVACVDDQDPEARALTVVAKDETATSYTFGDATSVGGNYTLSHSSGNLEGETVNGGPSGADVNSYPEYKRASWNSPAKSTAPCPNVSSRVWRRRLLHKRKNCAARGCWCLASPTRQTWRTTANRRAMCCWI